MQVDGSEKYEQHTMEDRNKKISINILLLMVEVLQFVESVMGRTLGIKINIQEDSSKVT